MASQTPISQSPSLRYISVFFGTICLGFGINSIFRPQAALLLLPLPIPSSLPEQQTISSLITLYGIKEIIQAISIFIPAYYQQRQSLAWAMLMGGIGAIGDGVVIKSATGGNEWNHWGYGGMMVLSGVVLLGGLDGKMKRSV